MISNEYRESGYRSLYYIVHVGNLESILSLGIYSNNLINQKGIKHFDLSDNEVQEIRDNIFIGNSINLHDFVNLFFNPRNSMLYRLLGNNNPRDICILEIDISVLDETDAFVGDGIVAKCTTLARNAKEGLKLLHYDEVFRENWNDPNPHIKDMQRSKVSAEALIKNCVSSEKIKQIIVMDDYAKNLLDEFKINIPISVNSYLFFR